MSKILYVEDDAQLANDVATWFAGEGHKVEIAATGEDAIQYLQSFEYDIILLDWNLPGMSGAAVCRHYRNTINGKSWVIFITGQGDITEKELAFSFGADDYIVKPFEIRELSARIKGALRRGAREYAPALQVNGVSLDISKRSMIIAEKSIRITAREASLLEFLLRNPDRHFSSKQLLASVWPSDAEASEATVRTFMRGLRVKFEAEGKPSFIHTDHGLGYIVKSTND